MSNCPYLQMMWSYTWKTLKTTKKTLRSINMFNKLVGCKINTQWTVWEQNQENNIFHNSFKKLKYLGINLMNEVTNICNENYKSLKKFNKDIRRQKDSPCSWINIVKMTLLPKGIYMFNAILCSHCDSEYILWEKR
jgi:hypothetical protein